MRTTNANAEATKLLMNIASIPYLYFRISIKFNETFMRIFRIFINANLKAFLSKRRFENGINVCGIKK